MELNWLLNEYDGIVYVSDMQTYELLHMNRAGCEAFGVNEESFRDHERKCYEVLQSRDSPCPFCTNHHLKDSGFYEWEHHNDALNTTYLLKDRKFMWNGREARIEFATDISGYSKKIAIQEKERNSILKSLPGRHRASRCAGYENGPLVWGEFSAHDRLYARTVQGRTEQ